MLKIEFSLAIALYVTLTVGMVLVVWGIFEKKKKLGSFSANKEKSFFWQCNICTYLYVDTKNASISQCPRCGSYNKKEEIT